MRHPHGDMQSATGITDMASPRAAALALASDEREVAVK
jgi:hypothetical protein